MIDQAGRKAGAGEHGKIEEADPAGRYVAFLPPSHGRGDRGKGLQRGLETGPVYVSLLSITTQRKRRHHQFSKCACSMDVDEN